MIKRILRRPLALCSMLFGLVEPLLYDLDIVVAGVVLEERVDFVPRLPDSILSEQCCRFCSRIPDPLQNPTKKPQSNVKCCFRANNNCPWYHLNSKLPLRQPGFSSSKPFIGFSFAYFMP